MTKVSWQDHFKKQIRDAEALYAKESTEVSLLLFCLRAKMLSSKEYLQWAREAHQIPVLHEKFFAARPPSLSIYKKYESIHAWNSECLPVAEWDGLPIVACLTKPENFSHPAIFVFTAYENLEAAWRSLRSSQKSEVGDLTDMTALNATVIENFFGANGELILQDGDATTDGASEGESSSDNEELSEEHEELHASENAELSDDIPDGLIGDSGSKIATPRATLEPFAGIKLVPLSKPVAKLDLPEANTALSLEDAATAIHQVNFEAEDPAFGEIIVEASLEDPLDLKEKIVSQADLDANSNPMIHRQEPAIEPVSSVQLHAVLVDEVSQPSIKPTTAPPRQGTATRELIVEETLRKGPRTSRPISALDTLPLEEEEDFSSTTQRRILGAVTNGGDFPKAPVKPSQTSMVGAAAYLLEKIRKQNQQTFDKEVLACFNQLKTFFKKSMLLAIGDKDRFVKPIMWDSGGFEAHKPRVTEFNLKTPSIFRVVSGTQKPYHGYVVVNDLNESFFESWNHGQIPDHVTIVPLMDHDLVIGMLVSFGEKSCYNKAVLQFAEHAAKDLSRKILRSTTKAA